MTISLFSSSILPSNEVFAAKKSPRDICKINQVAPCNCSNVIESLYAVCCTKDTKGKTHCETCDIDIKTGNYVNCTTNPIKSPNQSNLPDNVTVGGTFEPDQQQHNFDNSVNFNTTNDASGTFSNNDNN